MEVLRTAAASVRPFSIEFGPPESFRPVTPTLKLAVGGEGLETLHELRNAVFQDPLQRRLDFPFVPHVTIADEIEEQRDLAAVDALRDYRVTAEFSRIALLCEGKDRRWTPIADAEFAAPTAVSRGGLGIKLHHSQLIDPVSMSVLLHDAASDNEPTDLAVMARMDGRCVGAVAAVRDGALATITTLCVAEGDRRLGIGTHLVKALIDRARYCGVAVIENGLDGPQLALFFASLGFTEGRHRFL